MDTLAFIGLSFFALFAGTIPPGMINMSIAKITLSKNKRNGLLAALGAFTANILQAVICILLTKYLTRLISIQANMLKIGAFVFAGLTLYFLYAAIVNKPLEQEISKKDGRKSFVKGFFITTLNVLLIPYLILISTQLNQIVDNAFSLGYIILFSLSAASGTFSALYFYIWMTLKLQKRTELLAKYANIFMASLLFVLLTITLIRLYYV